MKSMDEMGDGELLAMLLELGMTVAVLARSAMEGSLDADGFALRELQEVEESLILIAQTQVLLDEVEIPLLWRKQIVNLLAAVEEYPIVR